MKKRPFMVVAALALALVGATMVATPAIAADGCGDGKFCLYADSNLRDMIYSGSGDNTDLPDKVNDKAYSLRNAGLTHHNYIYQHANKGGHRGWIRKGDWLDNLQSLKMGKGNTGLFWGGSISGFMWTKADQF